MKRTAGVGFIGTTPGPQVGRCIFTETVVNAIRERHDLLAYDIRHSRWTSGYRWKVWKTAMSLGAVFPLLAWLRFHPRSLYLSLNGRFGLWTDLWIVSCARLLGYRCFVHHHGYDYIDRKDYRMTAIDWAIGARGVHIVHSPLMIRDFKKQYNSDRRFMTLPPSLGLSVAKDGRTNPHEPFRIGHMSNLTIEKGLDLVLNVFDQLVATGVDVVLVLAGPCQTKKERRLVDDALERHAGRIEYRGPVYGEDKTRFFRDIDVFLFPTKYRTESWGIVLTESLVASVPVIAFGRACIPDMIGDSPGGVVVPPPGDFCEVAKGVLTNWINDHDAYSKAASAARSRGAELELWARRALSELIDELYDEDNQAATV